MSKNKENIEKLKEALGRLEDSKNTVYFLTYDTKNNPRASIKYIYDLAFVLKENGTNSKILVEDKDYGGVSHWLGDKYKDLEVISIKEDKVEIKIDDVLVVPEYYSNILQQVSNIKCTKVMLVQQKDYIFETLPVGSRWRDYGFDKVITTTEASKKYISEIFPEALVHIIPPIIDDCFSPSEKTQKPFIAISSRDRVVHRRIISEFYLKYPQLRWVTFRDMVQMSYEEFSMALKECFVSVWVDDESTFGTFPLESMKCKVPVIGKIPNMEPDWLSENGMWTYDTSKIVDLLGTYTLAWLEGIELTDEVKQKMQETLLPYSKSLTENNILSIFNSFRNKRIETINNALEKLKEEELV
jgi:glycosyltransferase involved in cell wall biosynthesis